MTVDEILASGRYTDRRGGHWHRIGVNINYRGRVEASTRWMNGDGAAEVTEGQMRLLIERDQHRDECIGVWDCCDHPVPVAHIQNGSWFIASARSSYWRGSFYNSHPEAMDAARALVVAN